MKLIDKYVGIPLCAILGIFCIKKTRIDTLSNVKKILFIKMFGIGSLILMKPLVEEIKNKCTNIRIYFLTFESNREIIELYELCHQSFLVKKNNYISFFLSTFKNILLIRKENIDISIDGEFFSRYTAIISLLTGIGIRVGFYSRETFRGWIVNRRAYFNLYKHMRYNYLYLGVAAGLLKDEGNFKNTRLYPPKNIYLSLQNFSFLEKKFILFNPTVSDTTPYIDRRWPPEYFIELGRYFINKNYFIIIMGRKDDAGFCGYLVKKMDGKAISVAGKTKIGDIIYLIYKSFLLVTNDSGPLHIAASLNTPTFSFFGTDTPVLYGYNDKIHTAFYKYLQCSPCLTVFNYKENRCEFNSRCLREITPKDVIDEFQKKENLLKEYYLNR